MRFAAKMVRRSPFFKFLLRGPPIAPQSYPIYGELGIFEKSLTFNGACWEVHNCTTYQEWCPLALHQILSPQLFWGGRYGGSKYPSHAIFTFSGFFNKSAVPPRELKFARIMPIGCPYMLPKICPANFLGLGEIVGESSNAMV